MKINYLDLKKIPNSQRREEKPIAPQGAIKELINLLNKFQTVHIGQNARSHLKLAQNNNFAQNHLSIIPKISISNHANNIASKQYQIQNHASQGLKVSSNISNSNTIKLSQSILNTDSKFSITLNNSHNSRTINAIETFTVIHSQSSNSNTFTTNPTNKNLEINLNRKDSNGIEREYDELRFQESEIENLPLDIILYDKSIGKENINIVKQWAQSSKAGDTLKIGRGDSSDIKINSRLASREHLDLIKQTDNSIILKDRSTNGTTISIDRSHDLSPLLNILNNGERITISGQSLNDLQINNQEDKQYLHVTILKQGEDFFIEGSNYDPANLSSINSQVSFISNEVNDQILLNPGDHIRIPGNLDNNETVLDISLPGKSKQAINHQTSQIVDVYKYLLLKNKSEEDPQVAIAKHYPSGINNFHIKQEMGVCYMLGAFESAKSSPGKLETLVNKVKIHNKGNLEEYSAEFFDENGDIYSIKLPAYRFEEESRGWNLVSNDTEQGIKILARLYAEFLKISEANKGLEVESHPNLNATGRDSNGIPRQVYTHLFNKAQTRIDRDTMGDREFNKEIIEFFKKHAKTNYENETAAYLSLDMSKFLDAKEADYNHAYAVRGVSKKDDDIILSLVETRDNSKTLTYSLNYLLKYIDALTFID
ncbi:MAG: FHA domain-containing protein [Candidatus Caenarcaniphilales bacterium]|nr:FHA domain-containing protein [Candidatus Caenarcaniphilales bacterium]